ncbi:MAG: DEAD/DEAH box helicase, partial [Anaerolineae bacterium]
MTDTNQDQNRDSTIVEPERALPALTVAGLSEPLRQAVWRAGWTELMPVQARSIPYLLAGRDLMVQSRTGSGKTAAFLLPIIDKIDPKRRTCQALVLAPVRELARQVAEEAKILAGNTGMHTAVVYGGVSYKPQLEAFRKGAHLVVGTPGRILDHLLKRNLSLNDLQLLIFDEADRMLSMGFYPDMRAIRGHMPRRRVQGGMFSATFPSHVRRLAREFLHEPDFLSLSRDHVHVTEVDHVYYVVPRMDKDRSLVRIIEVENPPSALIFCNTRARVHYVTTVLQRFGYDADEISSDLSQKAREDIMRRTREGKLRFLVATDVAARGIDLPELSHVIIYEPPEDLELYIHRAGRTGRAGGGGVAISLVNVLEQMELERIAKRYSIEM